MTPSGTSLLGLVKHLAAVEYAWFCETFGREMEPLPFRDDDPDADLRVEPGETTADIIAFYGRARAAADAVINDVDLEHLGTAWFGDPVDDAVGAAAHGRGDGPPRRPHGHRA